MRAADVVRACLGCVDVVRAFSQTRREQGMARVWRWTRRAYLLQQEGGGWCGGQRRRRGGWRGGGASPEQAGGGGASPRARVWGGAGRASPEQVAAGQVAAGRRRSREVAARRGVWDLAVFERSSACVSEAARVGGPACKWVAEILWRTPKAVRHRIKQFLWRTLQAVRHRIVIFLWRTRLTVRHRIIKEHYLKTSGALARH